MVSPKNFGYDPDKKETQLFATTGKYEFEILTALVQKSNIAD